jgi:hypothetical protein
MRRSLVLAALPARDQQQREDSQQREQEHGARVQPHAPSTQSFDGWIHQAAVGRPIPRWPEFKRRRDEPPIAKDENLGTENDPSGS